MLAFKTSKRHNTVEVAIVYKNINDRHAFEAELNLVQELSVLMSTSRRIHKWANDPIVRPNVYRVNPDNYFSNIILKFPIRTREEAEGEVWCYSYAGLHAVLSEIAAICKKHRSNFVEFSAKLNLEAMKAPWVLPVHGKGVILREGARQLNYHDIHLPRVAVIGACEAEVVQLLVLGEDRAVSDFNKVWCRMADFHHTWLSKQHPSHPYLGRGPKLDVCELKKAHPKLNWQNLGVFAYLKDLAGNYHWEQLGDMHNAKSVEYILDVGNHMLNTPMPFDNTKPLTGNNVFLNDHSYYSFESAI